MQLCSARCPLGAVRIRSVVPSLCVPFGRYASSWMTEIFHPSNKQAGPHHNPETARYCSHQQPHLPALCCLRSPCHALGSAMKTQDKTVRCIERNSRLPANVCFWYALTNAILFLAWLQHLPAAAHVIGPRNPSSVSCCSQIQWNGGQEAFQRIEQARHHFCSDSNASEISRS